MEAKPSSKKAIVILLVLIIVVLVVGILGYFAYTLILKKQPSQSTVDVRINIVDPSGIEVKEVESLELWVKGEGFEKFGKSLGVEERELSIAVPSGFNREFEATAKVAGKLYSATNTVDLEPNTRVVVEIKIEVTELGEVAEETTVPEETVPSGETSAVSTTTETTHGATTAQAPTVNLERVHGPEMTSEGIVFVRYKANVTGTKPITIAFNRDDSNGAWGKDIAQINLKPGQSFTLEVTATNSAGTSNDSVTLNYDELVPAEESATTTEELTTTTEEHTVNLGVVGAETGTVSDVGIITTSVVGTGDLPDNTLAEGFISFNISSLAGKSVQSATFKMSSGTLYGDPGFLHRLELRAANYGTLDSGDFGTPGVFVVAYPAATTSITYTSPPLVNALQALIDAGMSRAQLIIVYPGIHTDGHSDSDGVAFLPANISLEVTYIEP